MSTNNPQTPTIEPRCETCKHWEQPTRRPGLHQCFSAAVSNEVQGQFIATHRHEGCRHHAASRED